MNWIAILPQNRIFPKRSPIARQAHEYILKEFLPDISGYDVICGYRADDSSFVYEIAEGITYNQRRMEREDSARSAYLQNHGSDLILNGNNLYVRDIIQQRVKNDDPRL